MDSIEESSIKQFNQWARWFDSPIPYWQFYLSNKKALDILKPKDNSSVLDIGCGTGILLEQLLKTNIGMELYGIDISEGMIEKAKMKFGNKANLRVGSANNLPYKNDMFDYVTCCISLHHHPNTMNSMNEMYRVTKKGGKVLVLDPFADGLIRKAACMFDNFIFREGRTFVYTKDQMYQFMKKAGFRNITQQHQAYFKLVTIGEK